MRLLWQVITCIKNPFSSLNWTWVCYGGWDLSKEVLWVSVDQLASCKVYKIQNIFCENWYFFTIWLCLIIYRITLRYINYHLILLEKVFFLKTKVLTQLCFLAFLWTSFKMENCKLQCKIVRSVFVSQKLLSLKRAARTMNLMS